MNPKLLLLLALSTSLVAFDLHAQDRDRPPQGRGFGRGFDGPPEGGDRRGGPPGGDRFQRGQRPNLMTFLPVLKALDADGNGEISSKEIDNAAAALRKLDRNGDGRLTEDEVRPDGPPPGMERSGRGQSGRRPDGDMNRGRGFGAAPRDGDSSRERAPDRPDPAAMVKRLMAFDKNGDGRLGKDELSGRMQSLITRADKNGDGYADEKELTQLAEGQAGGRGNRPDSRGTSENVRPRRPEFDN